MDRGKEEVDKRKRNKRVRGGGRKTKTGGRKEGGRKRGGEKERERRIREGLTRGGDAQPKT